MKVRLLDGTTADINLRKFRFNAHAKSRSKFQSDIGRELLDKYPHDILLEEVVIPREGLILDFFLPSLKMAVECQGPQHHKHIRFFHGTKREFHQQQERDERKKKWCELNGIHLVEINYE